MAIQKPFNISVGGKTIDADLDNLVSWSISGAIQTEKSIVIKLNSDNSTVYTYPQTASFSQNLNIPASTLTNGEVYKLLVTVWDSESNSATSDAVVFQCSSTPVATVDTPTVSAPSYNFTGNYSQDETVDMQSWIMYIYDSEQNLIDDSGIQTVTTISYLFDGFQSDEDYYIELQVQSALGLIGTSGLIAFSVSYSQPHMKSTLSVENVPNAGVKITWDALQIIGDGTDYSFISGEKVDITNSTDSEIHFDSGYEIEDDFSMRILIESVPNDTFDIIENITIIECATSPVDTDALWLENPNQLTEKTYTLVASPIVPTTTASNTLWLHDVSMLSEVVMTVDADINQPGSTNIAWLDLGANLDNLTINIIHEDDYTVYLRRYNGTFYLYKNNDIVDELELTATNYCLVIKRINEVWSIEGGDVTP